MLRFLCKIVHMCRDFVHDKRGGHRANYTLPPKKIPTPSKGSREIFSRDFLAESGEALFELRLFGRETSALFDRALFASLGLGRFALGRGVGGLSATVVGR